MLKDETKTFTIVDYALYYKEYSEHLEKELFRKERIIEKLLKEKDIKKLEN